MKYLGVDYGTVRVGLALSDEAGTMGFPKGIIPNNGRLFDELCAMIKDEKVGAIVVGESRTLLGEDNPIAKDARALGEKLSKTTGVPVFYESEVFTSVEARRPPEKQEKSRSPKQKSRIDDSAAALILTSYLSRHHE